MLKTSNIIVKMTYLFAKPMQHGIYVLFCIVAKLIKISKILLK